MKNISEIDVNLKIDTNIEREGLKLINARTAPFRIYGVYHDGKQYRRLPADVAEETSEGVSRLSVKTAGGRVRFVTDSPYVAIKAYLPHSTNFTHMPLAGVAGFDMYVREENGERTVRTFIPPVEFEDSYELVHDFVGETRERVITINFPLYNEVYELYVGIKDGSVLKAAPDYKYEKPIVYYGSSITQGGCASRPGRCYQAIISREFDINYTNLGFSGNAKGEEVMAKYIAGLDMFAFVMDYDHNAPSVEHYRETHEPFFKIIREAHPDIPIVIMTRPRHLNHFGDTDYERLDIARKTYENAISAGDKNLYFIPGYELMELAGDDGCVDLCHPTDLGFESMARRLSIELRKFIK